MILERTALRLFLFLSIAIGIGYAQDSHQQSNDSASGAAKQKETRASADRVIIKVGETKVTEKEFEANIGDIEPKGGGDADKAEETEKNRRRLGDDYASVLMLSQLALANHLDATPEIRQKLAVARLQILSDAQFARLLDQTKASPNEVNDYYHAHLKDFARVEVRRLFIWKVGEGSKNTRGLSGEDAKARAAAIMQSAASGGDSIKLAELFKGSDQGILDDPPVTFVRGQLPAKLEEAAFTMKPGDWVEAEDTPDHLILIYLVKRDLQPLSDVNSLVARLVQGEKMQKQLDELKKKTGIWMDEKYFGGGGTVTAEPGEQRRLSDAPANSGNQ